MCVTERVAYEGLRVASASWHSVGVYGPLEEDAPVGIPFIVILDHLELVLGGGMGLAAGTLNALFSMLLMSGAADWRVEGVAAALPVTTRLPFAVHLMAAILGLVGELAASCVFRVSQICSGRGRFSAWSLRVSRLTTRLGLRGVEPAIAE